MLGQEVFSSMAMRPSGLAPYVISCDVDEHRSFISARNLWIEATISSSSLALDDVMLMMIGFVGKPPAAVEVVKSVRIQSRYMLNGWGE